MNQEEQRNLAVFKCLASYMPPNMTYSARFGFTTDKLAVYTAAVEAPLQARIAQLEEALDIARNHDYQGYHKGKHWVAVADNALNEPPSTWLSEHDKEVKARERDRIIDLIHLAYVGGVDVIVKRIRELKNG